MNYERRTNKAFTLIELVVAIAILAMLLSFAGVVFKVSIESYRTAAANAEIMRKLRAITDQLNADFRGIRKDCPIRVRGTHVTFFADGDFQSIGQHEYGAPGGNRKTVAGNIACIFYGRTANSGRPRERILARRQTILTADPTLIDPNAVGEHFNLPLYAWNNPPPAIAGELLDPAVERDLVRYMAKGVSGFRVHVADWDDVAGRFLWKGESDFVHPARSSRGEPSTRVYAA
ncbi:MAG: PulJ/GspJ family protein [Planctomycetota bacterium]|jgi:prepilin-type N-terminal cleavage/methylation domain-containing protein